MNNKGQGLAGWEALIIIILIGSVGFLGYQLIHKPSYNSIYQAESKPQIRDFHCSPFSCCNDKVDSFMETKKNGQTNFSVNAVKH